jgi:hypothetical protein
MSLSPLCTQNEPTITPSKLCPFSSEYAEEHASGGCSIENLKKRMQDAPKEIEILEGLSKNITEYFQSFMEIHSLFQKITALQNGDDERIINPRRDVQKVAGCPSLLCESSLKACTTKKDCANSSCTLGWSMCEDGNSCTYVSEKEIVKETNSNIFTWGVSQTRSLNDTLLRKTQALHALPTYLQYPSEKNSTGSDSITPSTNYLEYPRKFLDNVQSTVSQMEELLTIVGTSESQTMNELLAPLQKSRKTMIDILSSGVEEKKSLKGVIARFATFLRFTCFDRGCGERLDTILRVLHAPSCFPFINGKYVTQRCDNPLYKQCNDAAQLNFKPSTTPDCTDENSQ